MSVPLRNRRFYAPELDVLRYGAFLLVFLRHVVTALGNVRGAALQTTAAGLPTALPPPESAGILHKPALHEALQALDFGVCLFFFLSAFLITRLLLLERVSTGTVSVRKFYVRRVLRIWPLYYVFLLAVSLLSFAQPVLHISGPRMLAAALFVGNWAAVLHGWQSLAIQPLWSIAVEEQFYAIWPWAARFGRSAIITLSALLVVAAIATLVFQRGAEVTATWPNTLVQALFLASGALTACLSRPEQRSLAGWKRLALMLAGLMAWAAAAAGFHIVRTITPGAAGLVAGYVMVLLGTYLIFTGVAGWNSRRSPAIFLQFGRMSYGMYVFHMAVLLVLCDGALHSAGLHRLGVSPTVSVGLACLLGLALTTLLAALSYHFLETPFLRWKDRFSAIPSRPV